MDGQRQTPPRMAARYLERVRSSIGIADETLSQGVEMCRYSWETVFLRVLPTASPMALTHVRAHMSVCMAINMSVPVFTHALHISTQMSMSMSVAHVHTLAWEGRERTWNSLGHYPLSINPGPRLAGQSSILGGPGANMEQPQA